MNKLALGTVQFGLDYGISNKTGKVSLDEVGAILNYAKSQNIDTLDTAQGYGESEKVLGNIDLSGFKIVTKIIENGILETSLENLKLNKIYGLMLHREDEINDKTWVNFENYKRQKLVEKIGVSVYSPEKLIEIVGKYPIDIVQIPLNIFDQRFLPILPELKRKNIEIHTRSTFLQGLLFMNSCQLKPYFEPIKHILQQLPNDRLAAALSFVKGVKEIDKIVVGVTTKKELQEIYSQYNKNIEEIDFSQFRIDDEKFINPSKWELE